MPLPRHESPWPPVRLGTTQPKMGEWSAWMSGDPERLASVYGASSGPVYGATQVQRRSQLGRLRRRFWGSTPSTTDQPAPHRVHIPLPADICSASGALMWGTPPTLTTNDKFATASIERLINERNLWENMKAAFAVAAGLGGTYLRASWDPMVPGGAFPTWVDADKADPVFSPWGDLREVTFMRVLEPLSAGSVTVWRHLERHYLSDGSETAGGVNQAPGVGMIEHTLWAGTDQNIGTMRRFTEHYAVEGFASYPGALPVILTLTTGGPGLAVEYVKNRAEQFGWREDPVGAFLGRSDFDQVEPQFDSLDRVWSSLIREIDLAKARVFIPTTMLQSLGAGQGAGVDLDRELYVPMNIPTQIDSTLEQSMKMSDFPIRVDEHLRAINEIQQGILRDAGYSARTFGEDESGNAMTATEVVSRNSRSGVTRAEKIALAGPAVRRVLIKCLQMNESLIGSPRLTEDVNLSWPNAEQEPAETRARTVQMLDAAGSISLWFKLITQYPGMATEDLLLEYRRIRAEGMNNPDQVGGAVSIDDPLNPPEIGAATDAPTETDTTDEPDEGTNVRDAADAMGVLIRAGVDPAEAATRVGFTGMKFTGAVPTSLRLPAVDATSLEQV